MPNLGCFTLPMDVTATATRPVDIESEIPAAAAATTSIATPPHTHPPANSLSFSNGLKRRHPGVAPPKPVVLVSYKECLKNHAASLGGHALDGCGEFMPSPASTPADPTSLKCAACGCHRNFHRRDPDEPTTHVIEIHRHPPAPPRRSSSSPSPSPPPPHLSSYYSSAPHMLLSLRSGGAGPSDEPQVHPMTVTRQENPNGRKRFRTKFSQEQKEKMLSFAEKLGWKMQKSDEGLVEEFCNEAGVRKGVLKVWMHNNKHTFGKRDIRSSNDNNNNNGDTIISFSIANGHNNNTNGYNNQNEEKTTSVDDHHEQNHLSTNGSSSSS